MLSSCCRLTSLVLSEELGEEEEEICCGSLLMVRVGRVLFMRKEGCYC